MKIVTKRKGFEIIIGIAVVLLIFSMIMGIEPIFYTSVGLALIGIVGCASSFADKKPNG